MQRLYFINARRRQHYQGWRNINALSIALKVTVSTDLGSILSARWGRGHARRAIPETCG